MRITYVNTHDLVGGAERCSYDLARETAILGDEVELIVGRKLGDDPFVRQLRYGPLDWRARVGDYEAFMSEELRDFVKAEGIHVIGYRALRDLVRG